MLSVVEALGSQELAIQETFFEFNHRRTSMRAGERIIAR